MLTKTVEIQRESVEDRIVRIRGVDEDDAPIDPTDFLVAISFARRTERPTTFHAASWVAGGPWTVHGEQWYKATLELGGTDSGADVELAEGEWKVFARVTTAVDEPVIPAGTLIVR